MISALFRRLLAQAPRPAPVEPAIAHTATTHDIRKIANPHRVDGDGKRWSVLGKRRPVAHTTAIVLHQTACHLGERPARWATCGAHYGVTRSGAVIQIYDWDRLVWHGNGLSPRSIGIEIDGLFAGVEGDPATVWDDPSTRAKEQPHELTTEQIAATQALIAQLCAEVEAAGGRITALVAHRQASASRRADPGEAVWKAIALPMAEAHGLSDGGDGFRIGDGRAVPQEWDPRRTGRY